MLVTARKHLAQHFLIDRNMVNKVVECSGAASGDFVLEIGPGLGAFTQRLVEKGVQILAIERDPRFQKLAFQYPPSQVEWLTEDILNYPIAQEIRHRLSPGRKALVVSNIPYHLTSPILERLLPLHPLISHVTLIMQEEVARRCVSLPNRKTYGSLSLFVRYYSQPTYLFSISPTCFRPSPKVNSAAIQFVLHPPMKELPPSFFFNLVRKSFQQRRKMLRSSLRSLYHPCLLEKHLVQLCLPPTTRPEELSLHAFFQLAKSLYQELRDQGS